MHPEGPQGLRTYGAKIIKEKFIGGNLVHDEIHWNKIAITKNSCPQNKRRKISTSLYFNLMWNDMMQACPIRLHNISQDTSYLYRAILYILSLLWSRQNVSKIPDRALLEKFDSSLDLLKKSENLFGVFYFSHKKVFMKLW